MGSVGRNSAYKAYHMTSASNADSIVQHGYNTDLSEEGTNADVWGGGMYLATDADSKNWEHLGSGKVEATVDTRGFLTIRLSKDYTSNDEEQMFKDAAESFGKRQKAYFNKMIAEQREKLANPSVSMPSNLTPEQRLRRERREAWFKAHPSFQHNASSEPSYSSAFFKTLNKFHVPGLNIKYNNPNADNSYVGGNQIIVRDKSRIKELRRVK